MEAELMQKGLVYTKTIYEEIADEAKQILEQSTNEDARVESDEYGIYYNALAGLLRAGVLCSRVTGTDGFPEIRIVSGSKSYQCREDVLRTILGEEADFVISPYEDKFESYLDPVIQYNIPDSEESDEQQKDTSKKGKTDIKALKKEHRLAMEKQKKQYEAQIASLKAEIKNAGVSTETITTITVPGNAPSSASTPAPAPAPASSNAKRQTSTQSQEEMQAITKEKNKLAQDNQKLIRENANQKEKINALTQQLKQKAAALEEREKYHYDPIYDHYYSDELPGLISSLESTKSDLIFKTIAIFGCIAGIVISAITGFLQFLPIF